MKNKILFISINDHVPWGGSEELWSRTAFELNKLENYSISVLIKKWPKEQTQVKLLREQGVQIFYKNSLSNKKFLFSKILNKTKVFENHYLLDKDLVVISLGNSVDRKLLKFTKFLNKYQKPYCLIIQLATDLRDLTDGLSEALLEAYKNAVQVYFLSIENAFKTELLLGGQLENINYINNPFNYSQEYSLPPSNEKKFSLASVAAFNCFHKSQDLLIKVLSQEKWRNRDLILNLYGDGGNSKRLKRLVNEYNLNNKIFFKGFVKDKKEIWDNNHAGIFVSRMEGQSLAMLEGLSSGRIMISTKVGDAERLIKHKITGYLIDGVTFENIDKNLETAWDARNNWIQMGIIARKYLFEIIKNDPVKDFSNKLKKLI
ncbi:MAG: glycosyltransferase [Mesonia sp.]|uniref:glycosyltransferase n=1 Tax=Mesonia sp. TaxID=1960830 RepID=UPI003242CCFA